MNAHLAWVWDYCREGTSLDQQPKDTRTVMEALRMAYALGAKMEAPLLASREADRHREALEMIARHPCHAADKARPDWHCGECASCVAQDALKEKAS